jgi:hypothetical protein
MANTTFSGPVTSTNGFIGDVTGDITGDVVGLVQVPTYDVAGAPRCRRHRRHNYLTFRTVCSRRTLLGSIRWH